jgi:hypothetical protein
VGEGALALALALVLAGALLVEVVGAGRCASATRGASRLARRSRRIMKGKLTRVCDGIVAGEVEQVDGEFHL